MKMGKEKNFEEKVKAFLKIKGAWFVKYWGGGRFTQDGTPDLLVCYQGEFMGVEIKADNGKPSPLQLQCLEKIDKAGGYAILLFPDKAEVFKNFIRCLEYGDRTNAEYNYKLLKGVWQEWIQVLQLHQSSV